MLQSCTSPAAPFYFLDSLFLAFLESRGLDLPCDILAGLVAFTIGGAFLFSLLAIAGLAALFRKGGR